MPPAEQLIKNADFDESNDLSRKEFAAACVQATNIDEDNLQLLFQVLDVKNKGYFDRLSLVKCFKRQGKEFSSEKVKQMFLEAGFDPEKKIEYEEFKEILLGDKDYSK